MRVSLLPVGAALALAVALSLPRLERSAPRPAGAVAPAGGGELLSGRQVAFVPNVGGGLGLSGARLQKAFPILGAGSWIDLASPVFLVLPVTSDSVGAADLPVPVPPDPKLAGVRFYAQFFWVGPTSPRPCPPLGVSASHALAITVQP